MTLEELERDFKQLDKAIRIEAIRDSMRLFPPNKEGLYSLGKLYERELSLTFDIEPNSVYYDRLLSYRQDMQIMSKPKFTSTKLLEKAAREAKEVFIRVLTFA